MSTHIGPAAVVLDGWHPTPGAALLAAYRALEASDDGPPRQHAPAGVSKSDLAWLLGCGRSSLYREDVTPEAIGRWLTSAHEKGVDFELVTRRTPNGTSWKASARLVA